MKIKSLFNIKPMALAVTAATVFTGQAFALAPNTVPDITLYVSGASAQDKAFGALLGELCVAGTLDTYLDGGVGKAQRAFSCNLDSSLVTGLSIANPKVLIYKRSAGGSGMGVAPVADATPMEFMNVNSTNCALTATPNTYNCAYNATTNMQMHVSDAGLSDVEPALFVGINKPADANEVTSVQLAKLDVKSVRAGVFGIPVTTALRNALQQAQGLTVGSETQASMPSLSKIQVASLMAKNGIKNWNSVYINGTALTAAAGVTPPSNSLVNICRRVNGSGTQAQFNANFLSNPCTANALAPAEASSPLGPVVVLNSGSGDVDACLDTKNTENKWALGVLSTESNVSLAKGYRFIKIDGVAPTLENVWNNTYFDWAEESMQWRTPAAGGPALISDEYKILNTLATQAAKPSIIASGNTGFNHTWGQAGYLSLYTNGYTPNTVWNVANPVATASHGTPVNNCKVPLIGKPASLK
jgi:hypothetical protein